MMITETTKTVTPVKGVSGSVRLPGDKSISHRYAMLAALADGTTKLENFASAADCASTLGCVAALGSRVKRDGSRVEITGTAGELCAPQQPLDCGNSGSTMRMMAGIVAAHPFRTELFGDESLSRRPMRRVMEPLALMGAKISAGEDGVPPVVIEGGALHGIDYDMKVASAQVKSCVLFAGLQAAGTTSVQEPVATRDHSENALRAFGAAIEADRVKRRVSITGGQQLRAIEAFVPGDISTATFFLCAAAMFPGSSLIFDNVLLNPSRATVLDVFSQFGLKTSFLRVEEQHGELIGTVQVQSTGQSRAVRITGATTAALIDELPAIAALAPYTREGVEICDAKELRVKESDRIAAVAENLRRMGAQFEEREDGLRIPGGQKLRGAELESFGDHRIAMAFSIAALRAEGESMMRGAECVSVSFPEFYEALARVTEN